MALEHRIETLKRRHAEMKKRVHEEEIRPAPDEALLHKLKCQKLYIKDEMSRLMQGTQQAA